MTIAKKITDGKIVKAGVRGLCEGASVRTPCGPRRVEFVRKGDLIVTRDNALQPVRMIWTQTVTAAEVSLEPGKAVVQGRIGETEVRALVESAGFSTP